MHIMLNKHKKYREHAIIIIRCTAENKVVKEMASG